NSSGTPLSYFDSGGNLLLRADPTVNLGAATKQYVDTAVGTIPASHLSGTVSVANGGTGASTLAANNVILDNGTSAVQTVAPGSAGNLLRSNGTTWQSSAIQQSDLPSASLSGSGTSGYVTQYNAASTLANSPIYNNGGNIGIGTAGSTNTLTVNGTGLI